MLSDQLLAEIEAGLGEPLARAAKRIPPARQGKAVTLSCILRWIITGVRGPDGTRVTLEAARLGGRWITTLGAIRRFVEAQTPPVGVPSAAPRSSSPLRRRSVAAAAQLEQLGL